MIKYLRRRLFWKFFISYFLLILLSMLVLMVVIRVLLPSVFDSHLVSMTALFSRHGMGSGGQMMGGRGRTGEDASILFVDLFSIFNLIIFEAVLFAVLPSLVVALLISVVMSRQFVKPLQQMALAADRIAEGDYQQRLPIHEASPEAHDELTRLAVRFNRMTTRLEQIDNMRETLISDVAHELRTPLTVIKGAVEGLMDGVLDPDANTYEVIYRQADRLNRLVDDLQELNHIEMDILDLNLKPVNLYAFLHKMVETMQINFIKKGVALNLQISSQTLDVIADEDRLEQIMINLLSNSLRYTPAGGEVAVSAKNVSNHIQVSVKDTGIGIPEKHLPLVFSRFYRVDGSRSRQAGGSGIGLTIVRKLVEAQGGKIWAESAGPDKGAVFSFTLPKA